MSRDSQNIFQHIPATTVQTTGDKIGPVEDELEKPRDAVSVNLMRVLGENFLNTWYRLREEGRAALVIDGETRRRVLLLRGRSGNHTPDDNKNSLWRTVTQDSNLSRDGGRARAGSFEG